MQAGTVLGDFQIFREIHHRFGIHDPNPKNAPFTTIHTTASLDLGRIDSETLRKPFRPAKITFISKSVIYAG